jgi:hypothetical protein
LKFAPCVSHQCWPDATRVGRSEQIRPTETEPFRFHSPPALGGLLAAAFSCAVSARQRSSILWYLAALLSFGLGTGLFCCRVCVAGIGAANWTDHMRVTSAADPETLTPEQ